MPGTSETVGALPDSTQWIEDKVTNYITLNYNTAAMASQTLSMTDFTADYGSTSFAYPSLDLYARLFGLASAESHSWLRDFSIWGRYALGFADRRGELSGSSLQFPQAETDSLLIFSARISALLEYDRVSWIKPYIGMDVSPYYFRNTSDITSAEQQGGAYTFGPAIGVHLPLFFGGRGVIHAEVRRTIAIPDAGQLFGNSNNYSAGLGLAF